MAILARLRWLVPNIPLFGPSATTVLQTEIRRSMLEATLLAEAEVSKRTHVGATGLLRGSIMSEVRGVGATIQGVVATALPYAQAAEEGSRPHWAPIAPLKLWARRILGNERAAYAVRWAIHLRGTKAVHMFAQTTEVLRPRLPGIFAAGVERARKALGG